MSEMSDLVESVDGRTARRERNRSLVLDAVIELFAEHRLLPTAPEVAARSGVSLRSVFRYYEDTDALVQAAMARHLERVEPLFEIPGLGEGAFEDRVKRFTSNRIELYRTIAPTARAALHRAPTSSIISERIRRARLDGADALRAMFASELVVMTAARRRAVTAVADTLFQFEALEHLFIDLELSEGQATEALRHTLRSLLRPDG